jgi:hypothetical protein
MTAATHGPEHHKPSKAARALEWFRALAPWKKAALAVAAFLVLFVPVNALRRYSAIQSSTGYWEHTREAGERGVLGTRTWEMPGKVSAEQAVAAQMAQRERARDELVPPAMDEAASAVSAGRAGAVQAPVELASTGWGRLIIRTASTSLTVKDIAEAQQRIVQIADSLGGYIASANIVQPEKTGRHKPPATGTLEIRVPNEHFTRAVTELRKIGRMTSLNITSQDISEEYVDLESRLRHWRVQERLVLDMLNKAHGISDMLSVRSELSAIQQQIEQITGRLRYLSARVAMSSITVTISEKGAAPAKPKPPTFIGRMKSEGKRLQVAFRDSLQDFVAVLTWLGVVLAYLLPYAVLAAVAFAIYRRAVPRRPAPAGPGKPLPTATQPPTC